MPSALGDIRVLDLSRILAGPLASQLLGDLGADVIKVERPRTGDDARSYGPPFLQSSDGAQSDEAGFYLSCNRNKRSITIDHSTPEGADILRALAAGSDVFIENFRPGVLKKYGLDHESLHRLNPRLIYCSVTGFGQDGPFASRPGNRDSAVATAQRLRFRARMRSIGSAPRWDRARVPARYAR